MTLGMLLIGAILFFALAYTLMLFTGVQASNRGTKMATALMWLVPIFLYMMLFVVTDLGTVEII